MPPLTILCLVLVILLSACGSTRPVPFEQPGAQANLLPLRYSLVYVIHGDGSYLYHDADGNERQADEQALLGAHAVAESNTDAEVFIFHEKRRRPFLKRLWSRDDGEFFYYRNGRLNVSQSYRRSGGTSRFRREVELHDQFQSPHAAGLARVFLYYGHEVPEFAGGGYDASYKKRSFTVQDLAEGLNGLDQDSAGFDLVILSTCFNGTPHTIATLAPYARYIVASPDNLHLSYFDATLLEELDADLGGADLGEFARTFAMGSFDRLSREVQTAITVAVYDVNRAEAYAGAVDSLYVEHLATMDRNASESQDHYDCVENPAYALPGMDDGVDMFFRPAQFGREKGKQSHSGWECVRPRAALD